MHPRLENSHIFLMVNSPALKALPWLILLLFAFGLYDGLILSPADYLQKENVRILYIHVPAAITATIVYAMIVVASILSYIWKYPLADISARAIAPLGAVFTGICIVTGALWGRPTWGTYWQWDGRMTSVAVLFLLYLGYILMWKMMEDNQKTAKIAALYAIIGGINLPIIKFSVVWWNTLHQGSSLFKAGGPSIEPSMLRPLILMGMTYGLLFLYLSLLRIATLMVRKQIRLLSKQIVRQKL